ncbi:MAG: hypothetical protein ACREVW_03735 [Burkholderiales bacterium]
MKLKKTVLAAALAVAAPASFAATLWLPAPGALYGSLSYVHQAADQFFLGSQESALADDLELDSYLVDLSYGLFETVAVYGQLGSAQSTFQPAGENDRGSTDTRLGVAWTVLDEFDAFAMPDTWRPTVTLRAAAIIEGDYDAGRIDAVGDGGSGFEFGASVGRVLVPQFAVYGDLGYRTRADRVPADVFAGVGASWSLPYNVALALGYEYNDSQGELDIGGPGFSPDRYPEVEEDRSLLTGSLNWAFARHFAAALNYGQVLDGRNTPKSDVFGIALGTSF